MARVVAVHQPNFLPWIGWFDKLSRVDAFVIADYAQFMRNEWQNRTRLRAIVRQSGWEWITVPVPHPMFPVPIKHVPIDNSYDWRRTHLATIRKSYQDSPFFDDCFGPLEVFYRRAWDNLADFNTALIRHFAEYFSLEAKLAVAPTLNGTLSASERLALTTKELGGDTYLSGAGGHDYLDLRPFDEAGIQVLFQQFTCPSYPQVGPHFVPNLSIVDLVMSCGPRAIEHLGGAPHGPPRTP